MGLDDSIGVTHLNGIGAVSKERFRGFPDERFCYRSGGIFQTWMTQEVWHLQCRGGGVDEQLGSIVRDNSERDVREKEVNLGFIYLFIP